MNDYMQMHIAQDRIRERLAEAQRERLVRSARAAQPRPIEFHGSTGSLGSLVVRPIKRVLSAIGHAVHPVSKLGEGTAHA
ncbi:MAG: hypothetical protein AABZ33_11425 [Chloroflexota bacterium]